MQMCSRSHLTDDECLRRIAFQRSFFESSKFATLPARKKIPPLSAVCAHRLTGDSKSTARYNDLPVKLAHASLLPCLEVINYGDRPPLTFFLINEKTALSLSCFNIAKKKGGGIHSDITGS